MLAGFEGPPELGPKLDSKLSGYSESELDSIILVTLSGPSADLFLISKRSTLYLRWG